MIDISLKGLAKFMTAGHTQQRKVLRDYKYPDDEGTAQAAYYRDAREAVEAFHRNGFTVDWLRNQADTLQQMGRTRSPQSNRRYQHNARGLRQYAMYYPQQRLDIVKRPRLKLIFKGVSVSVFPDLCFTVKDKQKLIKLEFATDEPEARVISVVTQCMFEAALQNGLAVKSADIIYRDVARGRDHKGARFGARIGREIEDACDTIEALWSRI